MKALFIGLAWIGLLSVATSAGATTLLVGVDPETGEAKFYAASGVGSIERDAPAASGSDSTTLLPTQQISLYPETEASLVAQSIAFMTPDIIEALLRSQAEISAENDAFIAALNRSLGGEPPASAPDFDQAEHQANMDNLIAQVLQSAAEQAVLTPEQIQALIERAGSQAQGPSLADSSPPLELHSDQKAKRQAQLALLEKQRQQKQQQEQQKRDELAQQNQKLLARIEEQKRRVEQQNQEAAQNAADKARAAYEQTLTEAQKRRLAERVTLLGGSGHMDPSAPATPESQQDHLNTVAGVGGSGSGNQGSGPGWSGPADGGSGIAGVPGPDEGLRDVHTNYANQQQQSETLEEAAEELAALVPELTPEPIDPWLGYLANSDGPRFDEFPSESISGEAVGVYNGLVRGGFENGPSANGTMSLSISFATYAADGQVIFDNGQGVMSMAGDVGGPEFSLNMEGHAFGGTATGNLHGLMYGANGEEIGGGWNMHMQDGALAEQSASGRFAAKQ